jgi:hypothetical protein
MQSPQAGQGAGTRDPRGGGADFDQSVDYAYVHNVNDALPKGNSRGGDPRNDSTQPSSLLLPNDNESAQEPDPSVADSSPSSTMMMGGINLLLKLIFHACILFQVILWPSVMTITFVAALALEGIVTICVSTARSLPHSVTEYAVLLMHGRKVTLGKYILACIITAYMLFFFTLFVAHESRIQPAQTTWMHPDVMHKYTFSEEANTPFAGLEVSSAESKYMRNHPFVWPRTLTREAVPINGTITGAAGSAVLSCSMSGAFACYSARHAIFEPPSPLPWGKRFVPMPAQFYTADVIVTPPQGALCSTLEVYRLNMDDRKNIEHGLDYPASAASSSSSNSAGNSGPLSGRCNLFGRSALCLQFQHPFTPADYTTKLDAKCKLGEGRLTIRLPVRALDVHPSTGRMGHDILLVTPGATVEMRWEWHNAGVQPPLLDAWQQTPSSYADQAQTWRDSSEGGAVFLKYAIAVTPLLILWFYLAVTFGRLVIEYQVLMMCLFVLMPCVLFFLTVGAWLPMAGCIVCVIAINHTPSINNNLPQALGGNDAVSSSASPGWGPTIRHVLLFITAVCNSIQFVWILVLVQQAEWSAFLYSGSLTQLAEMSSQFIVSGTPMWVGLLLPIVLTINFAFLLGSAMCVAMEMISSSTAAAAASSTVAVPPA